MQSNSNLWDVAIIGGGPVGATAATYLAKNGYQVIVLEKEKFPREHVGESLLPFCYGLFEEMGVLEEMKRRFVRKPGVRFVDIDGSFHTTLCFGHVIKDPSYLSFHVIRAEFDQLLLDNARRHGATVREQTAVQEVELETPDGTVVLHTRTENGAQERLQARFLIDASGQNTFLARRMGWKRPHPDLDRVAFSTHWIEAKFTAGIEEGLLQIVYLGGDRLGWIWVIPVGTNRLSVGVVLNNAYVREQKAKFLREGEADWQMALYRQELSCSPFVQEILAPARIIQPLMVNGNYSYLVDTKYGKNFALVGDASTFIDPVFASGVYLGMNSARLVADALHRKFTSDHPDDNAPLDEAYRQINGAYALIERLIRLFYNPEAITFAEIGAAAGLLHQKHETALSLAHYLLAGDFFERHEEYMEFIDLLQDPRLVQKYKQYVIDRPEFQANTCGARQWEVFAPTLAEYEALRNQHLKDNGA